MTFLSFRYAKRKAKKMVNARPPRSPTASSASFVTASVVEIGDPTRVSAEACYTPMTLHLDVDIARDPLFPGDPVLSTFRQHSPATNPKEFQDRLSRSRLDGNSSKPLHHNAGWVQPRVSVFSTESQMVYKVLVYWCLQIENDFQDGGIAGSAMVGDIIQVRLFDPRLSFSTQQLSDTRIPPYSQNTHTNQDPDHVSCMQSGDSTTRGQVFRTASYVLETWRFSCH
jgi:hypothetical protein